MTITIHNSLNGSVLDEGVYGDHSHQVLVAGGEIFEPEPVKTYSANSSLIFVASTVAQGNESLSNDQSWPPEDSCDSFSYPYLDLTQSDPVRHAFIVIYVIVIILSLTGNWMVIWTVIRNKHMRTVTNYYIVNLAVSDFLVAFFVMPLKLLEFTAPCSWHIFNEDALCSFMSFVLPVFVFASVLTLVAISMERYYAIVYPLSAMKVHSKSRTRKILTCTWIIPMIVASPYLYCKSYPFLIYSHLGSISRQICTDRFDEIDMAIYGEEGGKDGRFRKGFFMFLFIAIYLVPLIVILSTCVRIAMRLLKPIVEKQDSAQGQRITRKREENKRRVARMIIVVAFAFIVAWSPFYLVTFISQVQKESFLRMANYVFVMLAVHLVGFINSCINPFIYNFMSDKFRKSFAQILLSTCCFCAPSFARNFFRSSHERSFRTSEYDGVYSAGDAREEGKQLEKHLGGGRKDHHSGSQGPRDATTIIKLSSLKKKSSSNSFHQQSSESYTTHLSNGSIVNHDGDGNSLAARDNMMSGRLTGCYSEGPRQEESISVLQVLGDRAMFESHVERDVTLEHEMDLFVDSSTSRLLRNDTSTTGN